MSVIDHGCVRDPDLPDAGHGACCIGASVYGPSGCTCWDPVHDVDQAEPRTDLEPSTRPTMCASCAFRPGSPERTGHPKAAYGPDEVAALGLPGAPTFWCHEGMRLTTGMRHPSGVMHPLPDELAWDPPRVDGVPYRADGTPGLRCGGQAAMQRAPITDARLDEIERIAERRHRVRETARAITSSDDLVAD